MSASFFAAVAAAFGKYDVVHFHAEGPCAMLWLPKLFGKRCIATVHGLDHQRAKWGKLASTYIMLGEKCAVKFADEIIVLSEGVQEYFLDTYGRETRFIPNGVNRPILRNAEIIKDKFGLEKDSYILFLGRLVPEKGLRYLIKAFKQVDTEKKLVIAGGSSDTDEFTKELKELARDDSRIIFTGFVQGKELDELCLQTKCLKNSRAKSLLGTLDGYMWKYSKAYSYVDAYICCSYFLKSKLDTQKRFRDKTIGLHNFKKEMPHLDNIQKKGYVLEFGHLSRDKGTDTLLEVAKKMPNTEFVFIGYGPSVDKMKDIPNVKYLGFKTGEELYRIIAEAAISVCPSEWSRHLR